MRLVWVLLIGSGCSSSSRPGSPRGDAGADATKDASIDAVADAAADARATDAPGEAEAGDALTDAPADAADSADMGDAADADAADAADAASWLEQAQILVEGGGIANVDCRTNDCQHNSRVDMAVWSGATWLVYRTARSDVLDPNTSLVVDRSDDQGSTFVETARLLPPVGRDIRDPSFFIVDGGLRIKALTRLPVTSTRDTNVDTETVVTSMGDAGIWSPFTPVAPAGWSFWRVKESAGTYYSAAYQDGDQSVVLYSSPDGTTWTAGATIYGVAADTPVEAELVFMPDGHLLALVRLDGNDAGLLGDTGPLRTKACWATAPYSTFTCTGDLSGVRLDGAVAFFWNDRLFVVAREHLQGTGGKKRTALYEVTGSFDGGALSIASVGELPSAGDTSYAGIAALGGGRFVVAWYSSDVALDPTWTAGLTGSTDVWKAVLDLNKLP